MRKHIFAFTLAAILSVSAVFAADYYCAGRTGNIYNLSTKRPIEKNMQMNLVCNTFSFSYKMERYYMVRDNQKPYSRKSLVGCQDNSVTNMFDPLVMLNSDMIIEKLTPEELRKANIRLVRLKSSMGELELDDPDNDFDLDKIAYIDLTKLRLYSDKYGEADLYLRPEYEDVYYNNSKYMEQITIEIQTKTEYQADNLF